MSIIEAIRAAFTPAETPTMQDLAKGLCVLPMPKKYEHRKQEKQTDMYVIDEQRNEFGFHTATATRQVSGSQPGLTGEDVELLIERDYWGVGTGQKTATLRAKNAQCKRLWHEGNTDKEIAAATGMSVSWVEKRTGTFSFALSIGA